ncbi:hypothetical protein AVEN_13768-1 [Araneus ventricosus]|uniref:Uncharacterized protein n=1 Tax=Araneus ventricosus TaxID=182803 RepID=A0A4Y2MTH3_ARAVE|nr:hypothetical protein AVEN_13768-1 [Araneus ventricosus]
MKIPKAKGFEKRPNFHNLTLKRPIWQPDSNQPSLSIVFPRTSKTLMCCNKTWRSHRQDTFRLQKQHSFPISFSLPPKAPVVLSGTRSPYRNGESGIVRGVRVLEEELIRSFWSDSSPVVPFEDPDLRIRSGVNDTSLHFLSIPYVSALLGRT